MLHISLHMLFRTGRNDTVAAQRRIRSFKHEHRELPTGFVGAAYGFRLRRCNRRDPYPRSTSNTRCMLPLLQQYDCRGNCRTCKRSRRVSHGLLFSTSCIILERPRVECFAVLYFFVAVFFMFWIATFRMARRGRSFSRCWIARSTRRESFRYGYIAGGRGGG